MLAGHPINAAPLPRAAGRAFALYRRVPWLIGGFLFLWALLVVAQADFLPPMRLLVWSVLLMGSAVGMLALFLHARKSLHARGGAQLWLEDHAAMAHVLGVAWASTAYFLGTGADLDPVPGFAALVPLLTLAAALMAGAAMIEVPRVALALTLPSGIVVAAVLVGGGMDIDRGLGALTLLATALFLAGLALSHHLLRMGGAVGGGGSLAAGGRAAASLLERRRALRARRLQHRPGYRLPA